VVRALTEELAAVSLQVPDQIEALHAVSLNGSRMTSAPSRSSWLDREALTELRTGSAAARLGCAMIGRP
jgi:hypothetical protein